MSESHQDCLIRANLEDISSDILYKIEECRNLRKRYILNSNQGSLQNPRDRDDWDLSYCSEHYFPSSPDPRSDVTGMSTQDFETLPETSYRQNEYGCYELNLPEELESKIGHYRCITMQEYFNDMAMIFEFTSSGSMKSFAYCRMEYVRKLFEQHMLLMSNKEKNESRVVPHKDFYNVKKVDTHVHHASSMSQKHLLRFMKYKMRCFPDEKVICRDGKVLTLNEVFKSLDLDLCNISIDSLDLHAGMSTFHRFDRFNNKYNPVGESRLREIFLKTNNFIQGRYLAEITHEIFDDLNANKYQMCEYRISIYGKSIDEWNKLADWVVNNNLFSNNVRWVVQVPRLYDVYIKSKAINSFNDILRNLFEPLFQVTINPKGHKNLFIFLRRVIGFDSVDDESKAEVHISSCKNIYPQDWVGQENPPYAYWLYYMYANTAALNALRRARNMNTFDIRPHCGEAGDLIHLVSAFLLAKGISHGILLRKIPGLQYLYYMEQIGISMSPLSNNALFLTYSKNPFPDFFRKGLNVCLTTDDPLQFHLTKEPLIEEYSVAAPIWRFESTDLCEIAMYSCLISGWELKIKKKWLGDRLLDPDVPLHEALDIRRTNVPTTRLKYRYQVLANEIDLVESSLRELKIRRE